MYIIEDIVFSIKKNLRLIQMCNIVLFKYFSSVIYDVIIGNRSCANRLGDFLEHCLGLEKGAILPLKNYANVVTYQNLKT